MFLHIDVLLWRGRVNFIAAKAGNGPSAKLDEKSVRLVSRCGFF
jgi:hypothetical protein